jgi:putative hydrolase of the HAD superfamily
MKRLLDKFQTLLFDMSGTFMFGVDRFGEDEDFYRTYCSIGGSHLDHVEVTRFIRACFDGMVKDYNNPACYDDFPSLTEGFQRYAGAPMEELPALKRVFATHEFGTVPERCASLLKRLACTHRLGLVSNIWSPKQVCLAEFNRAGIEGVFRHLVFSSDFRSIKPAPFLFEEALRGIQAKAEETLFIGDSLQRDMEGAKRVGLATAWITPDPQRHASVDYVLRDIEEIETCTA